MLPVETVNKIAELAVEALKPTKVEDGHGYWLIYKDPAIEPRYMPYSVMNRIRLIESYDSFIAYVGDRSDHYADPSPLVVKGNTVTTPGHEGSCVFYSESCFNYIEDSSEKNTIHAKFNMVPSAPWKWLVNESSKWYKQEDFVRLLRITLRDCLPNTTLLNIIREVKFTSNANSVGIVNHGRQSISRDVIEEVKGTGAVPEEVALTMKPYENVPFVGRVHCAVEIDASAGTFKLTPFPGETRKCIDAVLQECVSRMPEVACYYGSIS